MLTIVAGLLLATFTSQQHADSEFYALDYVAFRGSCNRQPSAGEIRVACDHIEIGTGEDISEQRGSRVEAVFAGRASFTFAGVANLARTNGRFPVDHIVLPNSSRLDATGQCTIERNGNRIARVFCTARTRRGTRYAGEFIPARS